MVSHACIVAIMFCIGHSACAQEKKPDPRSRGERPRLLPSPVPESVEFEPASPSVVVSGEATAGTLLRYNPSVPWEGIVTIDKIGARYEQTNGPSGGQEWSTRIVLAANIEPGAEVEYGGRGFTISARLAELSGTGLDGLPRYPEKEAAALMKIRSELRFNSRGVLEHMSLTLPPDCPQSAEWLARELESHLPLLVPVLPEQRVDEGGWSCSQLLASSLVWNWRETFHYVPEPGIAGSPLLRVTGSSAGESPRDPVWIGNSPVTPEGKPYLPGSRGAGVLRVNLAVPVTRLGTYSIGEPQFGKFPRGDRPMEEYDTVIRAEGRTIQPATQPATGPVDQTPSRSR